MENTAEFMCAFCGEMNPTAIEVSAGNNQSYVEDCQVCCSPNILYINIDEETLEIAIHSECES